MGRRLIWEFKYKKYITPCHMQGFGCARCNAPKLTHAREREGEGEGEREREREREREMDKWVELGFIQTVLPTSSTEC